MNQQPIPGIKTWRGWAVMVGAGKEAFPFTCANKKTAQLCEKEYHQGAVVQVTVTWKEKGGKRCPP